MLELDKLKSTNPKEKYGYAKELLKTSEDNPESLYPDFDKFVLLIENDNNPIKWTSIAILGNLSRVDKEDKVKNIIPKLVEFLYSSELITCNHAIHSLGTIARNKEKYKSEIIQKLLCVENYAFKTDECKNIAIGKVLDEFSYLLKSIDNKEIICFIERATENERNATSKKAVSLLKRMEYDNSV